MMSLKDGALNAAQAEQYYEEKYSLDDYYGEKQRVVGQWIGKGAVDLGLIGEVDHHDFSALLQGINPQNGTVLVPKASGYDKHAAGWDAVFNAPKSFSEQALIGEDHRLFPAHQLAVERAVAAVEQYAMARMRGGRDFVNTANIVGAAFTHVAARPVEKVDHGPDPHLHTHVVFLNMTRRPDGAIRALSPVEMYRARQLGSAVYRSELSQEAQRLGYGIRVTASDGRWELEGYSREQVMAFSSRREVIEQEMEKLGVRGAKAAQIVTLDTRQVKEEYDEEALKAEWKERAVEYGIDTQGHLQQALRRGDLRHGTDADAHEALDFAIAHHTNLEAVVNRRDLEISALQHSMGLIIIESVRRQIDEYQAAGKLVPTLYDIRHPQGAFTTPKMLALEQENIRIMREGQGTAQPIATNAIVQNWGKRQGLSDEQMAAAEKMLTSKDWITSIDAIAGSGKTYTVSAIRELAEAQGYMVDAFGPTTRSVHELQEAGLNDARTIASLLANQPPTPDDLRVWFVDEHSMMDSLTANRLLKAAQQTAVARIILVGDSGQHQAIQAGNPVKQFIDSEMTVAQLETIRRQETAEMREVVKAARHTPAQAFDMLAEQGRITEIANWQERYTAIAAEYLNARAQGKQALVVSPGNDERREINARVREQLVERGLVKDDGRKQEILVDRKLTPAQIHTANSYQQGDVILVHGSKDQQKRGLQKNSYVTIEAVDRRGNSLTLRTQENRRIEAYPAKWEKRDAEVFSSEHRTLAEGDRVQFRRPDKKNRIANGEFATLVELTSSGAKFHFDGKQPRDVTLPFAEMKHLDHGYSSTTYSAQGATVETCIMHADSMRGEKLLNRMGFYVGVSRPKTELRVFTNDAEALRRAVVRDPQKSIALEAIKQEVQIKQAQTQKQAYNHSPSMRI